MHVGDDDPQQTQQTHHQKRAVEPQPTARIHIHQNTCSPEHLFHSKASGRHKRVTCALLAASLATLMGCLADPHQQQSVELLDRLAVARGLLSAQPPNLEDGCAAVGDVQTRLVGEPGLSQRRAAWTALLDATEALQAVCGQAVLLNHPSSGSQALRFARERWTQGIQRELSVACHHLRNAANNLAQPAHC